MKNHFLPSYIRAIIIAFCILVTAYFNIHAQSCEPYLGQTPPGLTPEIFAPGIVSTPNTTEWSCTFSSDSTEMYFYRIDEAWYCKLYSCTFENGDWTDPTEVDFSAGFSASEPCFTPDNQKLYFIWDNDLFDFPEYYFVERTENGWSDPVHSGQGMWLSSEASGQLYTTDMSSVTTTGKTYLSKITTNNGIFESYDRITIQPNYGLQAHPGISPDGSYMLFDIDGGSHLFVSFKKPDGTWNTAIDLVDHGFDAMAGGPYISPDGKYLFFHMNGDIWWVDAEVITKLNPFLGIGESSSPTKEIKLFQNVPNPCRKLTSIDFELEKASIVSIEIFDLSGKIVEDLIKNKFYQQGKHSVILDVSELQPGIYYYALVTKKGDMVSNKMLVIK